MTAQPVQGFSAVKALQIAASQGQRIYHIKPQNQAQALPNLHLDGLAMQEITTALATGKEVIAHTDRISVPGWIGEGYILFDPVTGAGAYKITGGGNGGDTPLLDGGKPLLFASVASDTPQPDWKDLVQKIGTLFAAFLGLVSHVAGFFVDFLIGIWQAIDAYFNCPPPWDVW